VDYPAIALSVARNDIDSGELLIHTYAATPSRTGDPTTMRVVQIPDLDNVRVTSDGDDFTAWQKVGPDAVELTPTIGEHSLVVRTGYHGCGVGVSRELDTSTTTGGTSATIAASGNKGSFVAPGPATIAAIGGCGCC
jgi:hypothetical protein